MYTRIHILAAAVVGAAAGAAMGFIFARNRLEAKYEKMYQEEVETTKVYANMFRKTEDFESPVKAAAALGVVAPPKVVDPRASAEKLVEGLGYRGAKSVAADVLTRNRNKPYVIRADEFFENESGFDQITLTYFRGDDSLSDDADMLIEDVEKTVGKKNLDTFGQLSGDENTTHIRNEKLKVEYEIVLDHRTYKQVVAGLED
jgi:hypothetical protein